MKELMDEYDKLRQNDFELRFVYPTKAQREQLKIVHRDMTEAERKRLQGRQRNLAELIEDIESGAVLPEDLSPELARLRDLLG